MTLPRILMAVLAGSLAAVELACGDDSDDAPQTPPSECTRDLECELTKGRYTRDLGVPDDGQAAEIEVRGGECVEGECYRVVEVRGECFVNNYETKYDCALSDELILEMGVAANSGSGPGRMLADASGPGTGTSRAGATDATGPTDAGRVPERD